MKVSGFLKVTGKFWARAALFCPDKDFADEVRRLSNLVRRALRKELGVVSPGDAMFPLEAEMGETSTNACDELCRYLDQRDPGNDYSGIAQVG